MVTRDAEPVTWEIAIPGGGDLTVEAYSNPVRFALEKILAS